MIDHSKYSLQTKKNGKFTIKNIITEAMAIKEFGSGCQKPKTLFQYSITCFCKFIVNLENIY